MQGTGHPPSYLVDTSQSPTILDYALIRTVLSVSLARNPWEVLLYKSFQSLMKTQRKLVGFVFLAARQTLVWKQFINFPEVKQQFLGTTVHETLISILTDTQTKLLKIWDLGVAYNDHLNIDGSLLSA